MTVRVAARALAVCMALAPHESPAQQQSHTPLTSPIFTARQHAMDIARAEQDKALAAASADSARRAQRPVIRRYLGLVVQSDTTRYAPQFLVALDAAFTHTRDAERALFGNALDTLLNGQRASITERYTSARPERDGELAEFVRVEGFHGLASTGFRAATPDITLLRITVAEWLARAAAENMPYAVGRWDTDRLTIARDTTVARRITYSMLSSGRHAQNRACLDGSLAACKSALAIVPLNDTIGTWYDAAARRALVRTTAIRERRNGDVVRDLRSACVERGIDSACRALIVRIGVPSPTGRDARTDLLQRALIRGGPDAFVRLVAAPQSADIATILERTAGVPVDTLVAEWRRAVIAARLPSPAPNVRELVAGMVFAGIVIGASARRRP